MRIKLTGNTPRQELVEQAGARVRARHITPHAAIESIIDGARPGTVGGAMLEYYRSINSVALDRLIAAVEKEAARGATW
jgi:hypothetical protein